MSLDGLRAWIGEVERKLGVRTRVFLALSVIALGAAGAAIYLAVDTRDNALDKDDLPALETQAEAGGGTEQLASEIEALRGEVQALKEEGAGGGGASGTNGTAGGSTSPSGGGGSAPGTAGADALKKALEQSKAEAERNAGK